MSERLKLEFGLELSMINKNSLVNKELKGNGTRCSIYKSGL